MKTLLAALLIYLSTASLLWRDLIGLEVPTHGAGVLALICAVGLLLDFVALLPALAALIGTAAALTHDSSMQAVGSFGCLVLTAASVALFLRRELL